MKSIYFFHSFTLDMWHFMVILDRTLQSENKLKNMWKLKQKGP